MWLWRDPAQDQPARRVVTGWSNRSRRRPRRQSRQAPLPAAAQIFLEPAPRGRAGGGQKLAWCRTGPGRGGAPPSLTAWAVRAARVLCVGGSSEEAAQVFGVAARRAGWISATPRRGRRSRSRRLLLPLQTGALLAFLMALRAPPALRRERRGCHGRQPPRSGLWVASASRRWPARPTTVGRPVGFRSLCREWY